MAVSKYDLGILNSMVDRDAAMAPPCHAQAGGVDLGTPGGDGVSREAWEAAVKHVVRFVKRFGAPGVTFGIADNHALDRLADSVGEELPVEDGMKTFCGIPITESLHPPRGLAILGTGEGALLVIDARSEEERDVDRMFLNARD